MKTLRNLAVLALLIVLASGVVFASGNTVSVGQIGRATSSTGNLAFADTYNDFITWTREEGVSSLSFAIYTADTTVITYCRVYRVVNGVKSVLIAGDTLFTSYSSAGNATAKYAKTATITLAPLADQYTVELLYGSSNGVTTPVVRYEFIKQYSYKP